VTAAASTSAELVITRVPITHPDALRLIDDVQAFYVERYGSPDTAPIEPTDFEDPRGQYFLGYLDGAAVASGAWRRSSVEALGTSATAEIKRMYVAPSAQRRGLGRRMLTHIEEAARAAGVEALVLETGVMQPEAIALYTASGYEAIPGYGYYCGHELSRCFGRRIA
jgi:GNAT superfamily N-acetyltransferase